ncbi:MAG TPA: hypothetical protein VFS19_04530, partial [Planctomycetota bacterium]|nr:hypothetical protein [Planctomycetota bacterium]
MAVAFAIAAAFVVSGLVARSHEAEYSKPERTAAQVAATTTQPAAPAAPGPSVASAQPAAPARPAATAPAAATAPPAATTTTDPYAAAG